MNLESNLGQEEQALTPLEKEFILKKYEMALREEILCYGAPVFLNWKGGPIIGGTTCYHPIIEVSDDEVQKRLEFMKGFLDNPDLYEPRGFVKVELELNYFARGSFKATDCAARLKPNGNLELTGTINNYRSTLTHEKYILEDYIALKGENPDDYCDED